MADLIDAGELGPELRRALVAADITAAAIGEVEETPAIPTTAAELVVVVATRSSVRIGPCPALSLHRLGGRTVCRNLLRRCSWDPDKTVRVWAHHRQAAHQPLSSWDQDRAGPSDATRVCDAATGKPVDPWSMRTRCGAPRDGS